MKKAVPITNHYEFTNRTVRRFVTHSLFVSLIMLMLFSSVDSNAQCAMCRRTAETNMKDDQNNVGKSLNKGILYLLSVPYVLGGIALFAWYSEKRRKKNDSISKVNQSDS